MHDLLERAAPTTARLRLMAGLRPPGDPSVVAALSAQAELVWGRADPPLPFGVWRVETDGPDPLDHAGAVLRAWQRPPHVLRVRLVQYEAESETPVLFGEAVIGTRRPRREILADVYATAARLVEAALAGAPHGPVPTVPRGGPTGTAAAWLGGTVRHGWQRSVTRLMTEHWSVGVVRRSAADVVEHGMPPDVMWARPVRGTFLADPFPWPGTDMVLAEDYSHATGLGRIVALQPDAQRGLAVERVLQEDSGHHAYPFTFVLGGRVLYLPESSARGATTLYKLTRESGMERLCVIAPGRRLVDSTLFRHQDRFWIAATDLDVGAFNNVVLFHAERLEGPWRPHRRDPARIDIRNARPAGTPFLHDGALYRPAQDCSRSYGSAISINLIERLDPEEFVERPVRRIAPDPHGPFPHGLHTLATDGGKCLIDGKRMMFDPLALAKKLALRRQGRGRL